MPFKVSCLLRTVPNNIQVTLLSSCPQRRCPILVALSVFVAGLFQACEAVHGVIHVGTSIHQELDHRQEASRTGRSHKSQPIDWAGDVNIPAIGEYFLYCFQDLCFWRTEIDAGSQTRLQYQPGERGSKIYTTVIESILL